MDLNRMYYIVVGGLAVKRFLYRYRNKSKKIIGITLGAVGLLIIIYFIPIEVLLILIGIALLIMGALILKIK
jgi:drug/metabolite transporter (DMT)-like permease